MSSGNVYSSFAPDTRAGQILVRYSGDIAGTVSVSYAAIAVPAFCAVHPFPFHFCCGRSG